MIEQTGIDGVTVARGAIGNPWIFQQAWALSRGEALPAPPTLFQQREVIRRHWELAAQLYGEERAAPLMRKFGIKYAAGHPNHLEVRQAFGKVKSGASGSRFWGLVRRGFARRLSPSRNSPCSGIEL